MVIWFFACYSGTSKQPVLPKAMASTRVWTGYLKSCQSARCVENQWTDWFHLLFICACCCSAVQCTDIVL